MVDNPDQTKGREGRGRGGWRDGKDGGTGGGKGVGGLFTTSCLNALDYYKIGQPMLACVCSFGLQSRS